MVATSRPIKVRALSFDGSLRCLRKDGLGLALCALSPFLERHSVRLQAGTRGLVPATCLWCVAALVRAS